MAGPFTQFLRAWRKDHRFPLSDEAAEDLVNNVFNRLNAKFQAWITSSFGRVTSEELTAEQVGHLLLKREEGELNDFVVDKKTLFHYLFRRGLNKLSKSIKALQGKRRIVGGHSRGDSKSPSEQADGVSGLHPHAFDNRSASGRKLGYEFDISDLSTEDFESLSLAMMDLERWCGAKAVAGFGQVFLFGAKRNAVAKALGITINELSRQLENGKYCMYRRFLLPERQLIKHFKNDEEFVKKLGREYGKVVASHE